MQPFRLVEMERLFIAVRPEGRTAGRQQLRAGAAGHRQR